MPNVGLMLKRLSNPKIRNYKKNIIRNSLSRANELNEMSGLSKLKYSDDIDDELYSEILHSIGESKYVFEPHSSKTSKLLEDEATDILNKAGYNEFGNIKSDVIEDIDPIDELAKKFLGLTEDTEELNVTFPVIDKTNQYKKAEIVRNAARNYFTNPNNEDFSTIKNIFEGSSLSRKSLTPKKFVYEANKLAQERLQPIFGYKQKRPKYNPSMRRTNMDQPHINSDADWFDEDTFLFSEHNIGDTFNPTERAYMIDKIQKPNAYKNDPEFIQKLIDLLENDPTY